MRWTALSVLLSCLPHTGSVRHTQGIQARREKGNLSSGLGLAGRAKRGSMFGRPAAVTRPSYVSEKLGVDRSALRQIPAVLGEHARSGRHNGTAAPKLGLYARGVRRNRTAAPKVAFLFLLMRDLLWPELWGNFFSMAEKDRFSIYVHRAALRDAAEARSPWPLKEWGAVLVPWVRSAWCAVFGVEVAVLARALGDPANAQFVFVSESTIPLKRFAYVYGQLAVASPATSKFCLAAEAEHEEAVHEMTANELQGQCYYRDFYRSKNQRTLKHHQWVVLARQHAAVVVQRARDGLDAFEGSWRAAAPDLPGRAEGCSDEAAPLAALLFDSQATGRSTGDTWKDLGQIGVQQQCLTYVRWRNCFTGTPFALRDITRDFGQLLQHADEVWEMLPGSSGFTYDFYQSALKRDLNGFPHAFKSVSLAYLKRMVGEGFMFARKFSRGAKVLTENGPAPLSAVLPALWDDVDEGRARRSVWSSLDTSGMPARA